MPTLDAALRACPRHGCAASAFTLRVLIISTLDIYARAAQRARCCLLLLAQPHTRLDADAAVSPATATAIFVRARCHMSRRVTIIIRA